jgi:hypothetical protein
LRRFVVSRTALSSDKLRSEKAGNKRSREKSRVSRRRTRHLRSPEPRESSKLVLFKRYSALLWPNSTSKTPSWEAWRP